MAVILVDMDGVIADLETKVVDRIMQDYPESVRVPLEERKTFYLEEDYPLVDRQWTWDVMGEDGFYRDLDVMPHSQEHIAQLLADGHTIKICTSPIWSDFCVRDKMYWISKHFPDLRGHVITANDKTFIRGDILIDDKEPISGYYDKREWYHVPYKSGQRNSGTFEWGQYEWLNNVIAQVERGAL